MSIQESFNLTERQYQEVVGRTLDSLGHTKEAMSDAAKAFAYPVASGMATAALSYGVPSAIQAVKASRIRANRDKYIQNMKNVHPDMKEIPTGDLHIAYNSMAMHTPDILKDPLLGGQTLKRMARHRMADVNSLNEIGRLRGTNPLDQALNNATQALATGVGTGIMGIREEQKAQDEFAYRQGIDAQKLEYDRRKTEVSEGTLQYRKDRDGVLDDRYTEEKDYKQERDEELDRQHEERMGLQQASLFSQGAQIRVRQERERRQDIRQERIDKESKQERDRAQKHREKMEAFAQSRQTVQGQEAAANRTQRQEILSLQQQQFEREKLKPIFYPGPLYDDKGELKSRPTFMLYDPQQGGYQHRKTAHINNLQGIVEMLRMRNG